MIGRKFTSPHLLTTIAERDDSLTFTLYRPNLDDDHHDYEYSLQWEKTILYMDQVLEVQKIDFYVCPENQVSCIHGLICFQNNYRSVYICNPLTGEFVTAPKPYICLKDFRSLDLFATGFGFCSSINKYKIVHVYGFVPRGSVEEIRVDPITITAEVLTIGDDDSWRRIKLSLSQLGRPCIPKGKGVIINNVMYWITIANTYSYEDSVNSIISFDINKEEFGEISVSGIGFLFNWNNKLIELEGVISFDFRSGQLLDYDHHSGPRDRLNAVSYVPSLVQILHV